MKFNRCGNNSEFYNSLQGRHQVGDLSYKNTDMNVFKCTTPICYEVYAYILNVKKEIERGSFHVCV
jgi:hypothetical protein